MRRDDDLVEQIAARQREADAPTHDVETPSIETVEDAIALVKRDFPALLDPDFSALADRHINRLVDAGTPEPEAVMRGAREVAQRFGLVEREHADEGPQTGDVEEARRASKVIREMAKSRVGGARS